MDKKDVKKILVMRYRFIGDTLLMVPFLRNLRDAYPDAQIDVLVAPMSGEIIDKCPYVDHFLYFDTKSKHRYESGHSVTKTFWSYVRFLRKVKYDKVYVLKRSLSSAVLAFLAGIKERIGFATEFRSFLLTKSVPYADDKHEIECFLDVLRADGVNVQDNYLENWMTDEELQKVKQVMADKMCPENLYKVIVHATSGNRKKEWSKESWAEIVKYLSNEKGLQVVFNGTKSDSSVYEEIMSYIKEPLKIEPINFCGEFNLRETLAFTKLCKFIVGCDSGNLHIAASVETPAIGIYGPMSVTKWKAWDPHSIALRSDLPCQPCGLKKKCKRNYQCLKDITVDDVKSAIDELYASQIVV